MCNVTWGETRKYFFRNKNIIRDPLNYHKFTEEDINFLIESEKYYPKNILSKDETIAKIMNKNMSVARIGDGEYRVMYGLNNVWDNNNSPFLKNELLKILKQGSTSKCLVCINPFYLYENTSLWLSSYWLLYIKSYLENFEFNKEEYYGDAYVFSRLFENIYKRINLAALNASKKFRASDLYVFDEQKLHYLKQLFNNRSIVFVVKENSFTIEDKLNLFDGAVSKHFVYVPARNCIAEYDRIFKEIQSYDKKCLIYLECGEVATVLAYKLSELGYQALDMGNFYMRFLSYNKECNAYIRLKNKELKEKTMVKF